MFNTALKNIRRSPYQALAAILVLSINLFVIAQFLLISLASQAVLSHFETRPKIIAYLNDQVSESDVNQTIVALMATNQVKDIRYVSKAEALEIYKEVVNNDPLLLGTVTELGEVTAETLPASIEITVKSANNFDPLVSVLENSSVVSTTAQGEKEIDYPRDVVGELMRWTNAVRTAGLGLIILLTATSVITITIIISMKIASRRTEITTMKLIGARNGFILKPYLSEALIYSALSAVIGWLVSFIVLLYSTPFLASRLAGIISLPVPPLTMAMLFLVVLSFSLLLGLFSGIFAGVRFLRR